MLEIKNLTVCIDKKEILHNLNLKIPNGEVHVLFGPNGSGKTTLMKTIIGYPEYEITQGSIRFDKQEINKLKINERANLGIGISQQRPPVIKGVKVEQLIKIIGEKDKRKKEYIEEVIERFEMKNFLERNINAGFSGGEIKMSELFQILITQPRFLLIDEPDSGVDPEKLVKIGEMTNECLRAKNCSDINIRRNAGLIITHSGFILEYVHADKSHLLINGNIVCSGNPRIMLEQIREEGYEYCVKCQRRTKNLE